ncbi:MAG: hypothetical protein ABI321_18645 [Polyangia bacterium]
MRRYLFIPALALAGCAHFPPGTPQGKDAGANAVLGELAKLRGEQAKPVAVQQLDDPTFHALVEAQLAPDAVAAEQTQAGWRAFGFSPPDMDLRALSRESSTEQLYGRYDYKKHVLVIPKPKQDGDALELRQLLLHEVEHALQDQRHGAPHLRGLDEDRQRAVRAVYESDAMLALLLGHDKPDSASKPNEALDSLRKALPRAQKSIFDYLSFGPHSRLHAAPEPLRRLILFPYMGALPLLVDVQLQGGYALRESVFRSPPDSTEQLLHLEKYRSGEQPIEVSAPIAPPGTRRLAGGVLGELGIRALFGGCLSSDAAAQVASGWGGDAYIALSSSTPTPGLLWSTVWDDEKHAVAFASAMHELQTCWQTDDPDLAQGLTIERRGASVAVARGAEGKALFALVHGRGRAHPRALAAFPPDALVPTPVHHLARIETDGDVSLYIDDELGLEAQLPEGAKATAEQPGLRLALQSDGAMGLVSLAGRGYSGESAEDFFQATYGSVGTALARGEALIPMEQASRVVDVGWSKGLSRSWRVSDTGRFLRAVILPVCGGKASLGFAFAGSQAGVDELEAWLKAFALRTGIAPACTRL